MHKINFDDFCKATEVAKQSPKIDSVILFMWYHHTILEKESISIVDINQYFSDAHLPQNNVSRLKNSLRRDVRVTKGVALNSYKLNLKELNHLNNKYNNLVEKESEVKVRANLYLTPFLDKDQLRGAEKMSQLYIILYCWENSVRKFIEKCLTSNLGQNWWEITKNQDLEKKVSSRKSKEEKQKWTSPRGTKSPLYYLDWGDLVKIIRKHEDIFKARVSDIKFIELRLEELERLRNIIAHNGLVPEENDIDRIIVHFKDWCNQIS